mgnify:CR=1 FL=1
MGILLRVGGISLIIGTLALSVGSYASFRRVQMAKVGELIPGIAGSVQGSEGWVTHAPLIGLILMGQGIIAVVAVLFLFIRNQLS